MRIENAHPTSGAGGDEGRDLALVHAGEREQNLRRRHAGVDVYGLPE
jgi:hypothetical protein